MAEVVIANTNKLKIISFTDKKTDRVDAEKLARIIKTQVLSGEEQVHPVPIPPKVVQDLRALFTTYRLVTKKLRSRRTGYTRCSSKTCSSSAGSVYSTCIPAKLYLEIALFFANTTR